MRSVINLKCLNSVADTTWYHEQVCKKATKIVSGGCIMCTGCPVPENESMSKCFNILKHILFKAILQDVMGEEKFCFSLFLIIHLCNDPFCHCILSPQCIHAGYFV